MQQISPQLDLKNNRKTQYFNMMIMVKPWKLLLEFL
jgi:hypothetical protein